MQSKWESQVIYKAKWIMVLSARVFICVCASALPALCLPAYCLTTGAMQSSLEQPGVLIKAACSGVSASS